MRVLRTIDRRLGVSLDMGSGAGARFMRWDPAKSARFGAEPLMFPHMLQDHPLFSEASLARLLDGLDRQDYFVNTMDVSAHNVRSRREGEIRGLGGLDVLKAVKTGRIWILLLRPDKAEPAYRELLNDIYAEMESQVAGLHTKYRKMTILISSPNVQVYYHCDIPGQTLWQVRGEKRVFVYPNKPPFLDQAALEKIALGEAHEISLPYSEDFDSHATVFNLRPGQMLHWPLNAPHRIVNGDSVNVSFTTEHFTSASRRRLFVNVANGVLRSRLGWRRLSQRTTGPGYWAKLGVAAAYKLASQRRKKPRTFEVDFAVDPQAPNAVRTIPKYEMRG